MPGSLSAIGMLLMCATAVCSCRASGLSVWAASWERHSRACEQKRAAWSSAAGSCDSWRYRGSATLLANKWQLPSRILLPNPWLPSSTHSPLYCPPTHLSCRTYRAHGRINAYMSSPCHIELILAERGQAVKAEAVSCLGCAAAGTCCGPAGRFSHERWLSLQCCCATGDAGGAANSSHPGGHC